MRPKPLEDIRSTLWIKKILPLVSRRRPSHVGAVRLQIICMTNAEVQRGPGCFGTSERSPCDLWSFAHRPRAEGVSWSVRPPEIDPLLDNTPGNEVDGKGWGKENCAARVFWSTSEENVEFAPVRKMFVFLHPTSTFLCLFVYSVNWSFKTLVGQWIMLQPLEE